MPIAVVPLTFVSLVPFLVSLVDALFVPAISVPVFLAKPVADPALPEE